MISVSSSTVSQINSSGIAILDGLAPLAKRLTVPVNEIWNVMLQHNNFVGAMLVLSAITMIVSAFGLFKLSAKWKRERYGDGAPAVFVGAFAFFLLACSHYPAYHGLERLFVSKYTTAVDVVELVNQLPNTPMREPSEAEFLQACLKNHSSYYCSN